MRIYMFAILNKAKHYTEHIRYLKKAVVRYLTVLVFKIMLQTELLLIRHNLMYEPRLKEAYYRYNL
jgi:hypothetical protein